MALLKGIIMVKTNKGRVFMKKSKVDVIVIGGSAAGLVAASTTKSNYPDKSVMVIRKEEKVMIPCGIPYIFGTLDSSDNNILPDGGLINLGVEIKVDTVTSINHENHTVETEDGSLITYEKLVIATGSTPFVPSSLKGTDLDNVFTVPKNKVYLDQFKAQLKDLKKVAVIGAGFIGVEVSDELVKAGHDVTLVELQDHILGAAFDDDSCCVAGEVLQSRGVKILTGTEVKSIDGDKKVDGLTFADGTGIEVDAVILSIGYKANIELAKASGISCNKQGSIKVDAYMRTHQKDVFACGDCAQKRDFITGRITNVMLASTACAEARVAAMNLYDLSTIKTFNGTISIYSTNLGDTTFGVAGITEKTAQEEGFDVLSATFKGMDRHPGKLNNPHYQMVKLVANKTSGLIMGGEVIGGVSAGELTNVLGFVIQNKMTITDLLCSQIGTQPMVTASPAAYPLIKAAEMISRKMIRR
jgi:NADPH-dependent 2,4-dienoyl-CoA reductase/sulfur reductase-like enzyme